MSSCLHNRTLLFFLFIASSYLGPVSASAQMGLGARAGLNISTFRLSIDDSDTSNPMKFKYCWGPALGGYVQFPLGRWILLQPEIQYTRLGGQQIDDYDENETYTTAAKSHWLQAILLARMNFSLKGVGINLVFGPHFGYSVGKVCVHYTYSYTSGNQTMTEEESEWIHWDDVGESLRRFEPGITAGLGVDYPLGPGRLSADFRFQRGFSSWINPEPGLIYFSNLNYQFGLSYTIRLASKAS